MAANKKSELLNPMNAIKDDSFHIEISVILTAFRRDPSISYYTFKNTLTNVERKYVHERCRKMGLISRSTGKDPNRVLTIFKRNVTTDLQYDINLTSHSDYILNNFFVKNESIIKNLQHTKRDVSANPCIIHDRLVTLASKAVDRPKRITELRRESLNLPINVIRESLLNVLENNQIIIITAETGSGKTTQVPQIILDDAAQKGRPCRIVCTQPRRLSTVTIACRVAAERGETVPNSVGYQIKLESNIAPQVSLIYTTTGVLLKTLISEKENIVDQYSHIIIDEIHERDRFTDFLLVCLRECLLYHPKLKIILMSATMDIQLFEDYFPGAQIFNVQGRTFDILEYFLEDIVPLINYESYRMLRIREQREDKIKETMYNDEEYNEEMEEILINCMENLELFPQMWQMILSENVSVNYVEKTYGYTPLIVASSRGQSDSVKQLLFMGANKNFISKERKTAFMYAKQYRHENIAQLLSLHVDDNLRSEFAYADYIQSVSPEYIDYQLISNIIIYIHEKIEKTSAILVFLSGYDDIINCKDAILKSNINKNAINICMLHGSMNVASQNEVFNCKPGKQKIILATNVAETSITIDAVAYVIDTGRVKEKSYDSLGNAFALSVNWISKASAKQRAGRAGRCKPGVCFHIYSRERYNSMLLTTIPEILRVPLQELCMDTKLLAPKDTSIADFLSRAMEPPTKVAICKAIDSLKMLGALDEDENLTKLGNKLLNISVEPQFGKMLLFAITYKCLDPVLTIVSCLVNKDPFMLPPLSHVNVNVMKKKKELAGKSLSDHMLYLKTFLMYQDNLRDGSNSLMWNEYHISKPIMDMILATRMQLMGQLRALGYVGSVEAQKFFNSNSNNWSVVKMVLLQGLYPNIAYYNNNALNTRNDTKVNFHKSSTLKSSEIDNKSTWFMYEELSKANSFGTLKCSTAISPAAVALTCGSITHPLEDNTFTLDNWIEFNVKNENLYKFRAILGHVSMLKIDDISHRFDRFENVVIETVVSLLTAEDAANGFVQPSNIGEPPRIIKDFLPFDNLSPVNDQKRNRRYRAHVKYPRVEQHKYFLIKTTTRSLQMGMGQMKWKFEEEILPIVLRHINDGCKVTLIFTIQQRRAFSAVARVTDKEVEDCKMSVEWLRSKELSYFRLKHLRLPNICICQNGYEFSPHLGRGIVQGVTNWNRNVTQQNVTPPRQNDATSEQNVKIIRSNVRHPREYVTNPGQCLTNPGQYVTNPGQCVTHPGQSVTNPGQNLTIAGQNAITPGQNITIVRQYVRSPGRDAIIPGQSFAIPRMN